MMKQKIALYILSMTFFFIIVGLLCMDLPICYNGEFIGFDQLWKNIRVGIVIISTTIVIEIVVYRYLKNLWNHTSKELTVEVVKVEEQNYDTLTFIASFMIPLVSFQLHQLSHWIVLAVLVIVVGVIFCNSKGYYTNPTLALLGFHLYNLSIMTQQVGKGEQKRSIVMISRERLETGSRFRYVKITDEVGYVI